MPGDRQRVVLIEPDADLRELSELILSDAGFQVLPLPPGVDPVAYAEQTGPDVIVMSVRPLSPEDMETVDRLQANAETRKISLVAVSTLERIAAETSAAPSARFSITAPYDVDALVSAVRAAVQHPPPAAAVPSTARRALSAVTYAAEALSREARHIAVRTLRRLRESEPYRSRFPDLSRGLVDSLGVMLGAIAASLSQDLSLETVYGVPAIRQAIDAHVELRVRQGLGLPAVIYEYQVLGDEIREFLRGLINPPRFSGADALDVSDKVQHYLDGLIRLIMKDYQARQVPND